MVMQLDHQPKDCTHRHQGGGSEGRKVLFTKEMTLQLKKKDFLSNKETKQSYIGLLGRDSVNLDVMCFMQNEMLIY